MRSELIKAAALLRNNSEESLEEVLKLLQRTVYAFSMRVCGHPEDAEDTMQDVLLRSLPHIANLQDEKALAVWLYTVTKNRCWRMRRKAVHAPRKVLSLDELLPQGADLEFLLRDSEPDPETQILSAERNRLLHEAILSIPPEYRIVLVLHDIEDLDTEVVAKVLNILPGTVRVRLHRARLYVRKALSKPTSVESLLTSATRSMRKKSRNRATVDPRAPQCREVFANLSEYLDGRMAAPSCDEMRHHIEACPACVAFINDLRRAIDRCGMLDVEGDSHIPTRLRTLITEEYRRLLNTPLLQKKAANL